MIKDFFIGFIGSLTAAIVFLISSYFFSRRFKTKLVAFVLRALGAGIEYVYQNQKSAESDIVSEVKHSNKVKIIQLRGHSVTSELAFLDFLLISKPYLEVLMLLANPDAEEKCNQVIKRAIELSHTEHDMSPDLYVSEVQASICAFYKIKRNPKAVLRLYLHPVVFRQIMCDNTLFLSYFPPNKRGKHNFVFRIPSTSPLYEMMDRYFEAIWNDCRTIDPPSVYFLSKEQSK